MNKTIARRVIKASAMQNMQGNWLRSFALIILRSMFAILILGFLPLRIPLEQEMIAAAEDPMAFFSLFLPQVITTKTIASIAVTVVLYLLVLCPFSVGVSRFFLKIARGEKGKFSDVFSAFTSLKTVFGAVWLSIIKGALSLFWSVFLFLMPIIVSMAAVLLGSMLLMYLSMLMLAAAAVFLILWTSRYSFATYIFADRGSGAFSAIRDCIRLLGGRNGEILLLRATYIGWDIASTYIPAVGFVYSSLSGTVYAKYIYYLTGQMAIGEPGFTPEA